MTYKIPSHRLPEITTYVEKLNSRAAKLGCSPIIITIQDKETYTNPDGEIFYYSIISIEGEAPRLNGWAFLSKIDHISEGNIIKTVPGISLPEQFRTADPICQHCNQDRNRKTTYILQDEQGEYKQVGSTCLADFLGHADPKSMAALAESMADVIMQAESMEESEYSGGKGSRPTFELKKYLSYVALSIRIDGWMSRKAAEEKSAMPTSSAAFGLMFPSPKEEKQIPESRDVEIAEQAIEWAKDLDAKNDYEHNLRVIACSCGISSKHFGFAASMIAAYKKHMGQEQERKQQAQTSNHFGTVGKREIFTLTVYRIQELPGNFGVTFLHMMKDEAGNIGKWFSSSGCLDEHTPLTIKATVKGHEEYKGIKQTILSRCSIVEPKKEKAS